MSASVNLEHIGDWGRLEGALRTGEYAYLVRATSPLSGEPVELYLKVDSVKRLEGVRSVYAIRGSLQASAIMAYPWLEPVSEFEATIQFNTFMGSLRPGTEVQVA